MVRALLRLPEPPPPPRSLASGLWDAQQLCRNGHLLTAHFHDWPPTRRTFCAKCGAAGIHACEECRWEIVGAPRTSVPPRAGHVIPVRPAYCDHCSHPFPWTKPAVESETPTPRNTLTILRELAAQLPTIARELARPYRGGSQGFVVKNEYDAQHLCWALIRARFDDVRLEEPTPSHAGGYGKVDCLLSDEEVGVELKHTRDGLADKEIGDELIEDSVRYAAHPKCRTLFCLVYDPEHRIRNPRGLEKDLSVKHGSMDVVVVIVS